MHKIRYIIGTYLPFAFVVAVSLSLGIIICSYLNARADSKIIEQKANSQSWENLQLLKEKIEGMQKGYHQENNIQKKAELEALLPVEETWLRVKDKPYYEEVKNSQGQKFISLPNMTSYEGGKKGRMNLLMSGFSSPIDDYGLYSLFSKSEELGINPSVPFCIALSDSKLGTEGKGARLKNPCNLGNDDRGRERSFDTYKDGLIACVEQLDRPQYKNTDLLGELSNGGRILLGLEPNNGDWNTGDKVWATAEENHIINMIRCVRAVENDSKLDYNFKFKN